MGIFSRLKDVWTNNQSQRAARVAAVESEVKTLSQEVAQELAIASLIDAGPTNSRAEVIDPDALSELPDGARAILSRFQRFEIGGLDVGGNLVTIVEAPLNTVRVGRDLEHAVVLIARHEETLWVLEPDELASGAWSQPYPSLAHYIVMAFRFSRPGWWMDEPDAG